MLVQYTPIYSLSADELARLKHAVRGVKFSGLGHFTFEGKSLLSSEIIRQQKLWEAETLRSTRQTLLG
jgi:hypothetical protein